ncbi:hypothetical protein PFISCL1PPCAC_5225, partial [Pristionchus fissidentatus]
SGIVNAYMLSVAAYPPNFACAALLRLMLNRNCKWHVQLSDTIKRTSNDKYSLSLRVQLKENIWSMQKIEFGFYVVIFGVFVNMIVVFTPIFILKEPEDLVLLQWCQWAGNIFISISVTCSVPMSQFAIALHSGKLPAYARWYMRKL